MRRHDRAALLVSLASLSLAACAPGELDAGGVSTTRTEEGLSGCHGVASSSVPASGSYYLTTFGTSPSDDGQMSCGSFTRHGSWYYAASRQRYGCGAHIRIEANGHCVVAQTDDYGPDACVENAAGRAIIDASPLVAQHLFGASSAGWSDRFAIHVVEVARTTPLGPCGGVTPPPPQPRTSCHSGTLERDVPSGTCVQSSSDHAWYHCAGGTWVAGQTGCTTSYAWCHSSTLGRDLPPRSCVQSVHDRVWYQCGSGGWAAPVASGAGPVGTCSAEYPL